MNAYDELMFLKLRNEKRVDHQRESSCGDCMSMLEAKARQCAKLREIRAALVAEGLFGLDQQAAALGLSRSTAWVVAKGHHKGSGLTAAVIKKMLASTGLPAAVRPKILEYVQEKAAGLYGHHLQLRRRFLAQLDLERLGISLRDSLTGPGYPELIEKGSEGGTSVRKHRDR